MAVFENQGNAITSRFIESYHIFFAYSQKTGYICIPPSGKKTIEAIVSQYIQNGFSYIDEEIAFDDELKNRDVKHSVAKSDPFDFNKYVKEITTQKSKLVVDLKCELLLLSHEHITHTTDIVHRQAQYTLSSDNNYIVLMTVDKKGLVSEHFGDIPHGSDMYIPLMKQRKRNSHLHTNADEAELFGVFAFPPKLFARLLDLLAGSLNGDIIAMNRCFIKSSWINAKVFNENISVIFNPRKSQLFDAEGTLRRKRYLIQNGVLTGCCNNIRSATLLQQVAGNTWFNYFKDEISISQRDIELHCKNRMRKTREMHFAQAVDNDILMNIENGFLDFAFTAKRVGEAPCRYVVKMPLVEFFDKIIGVHGKRVSIFGYRLAGTIMEFN
jgi:hypothetical protein